MEKYVIEGGNRLDGSIKVQGAKNSCLPILAATLLIDGKSVIKNCPDILDVSSAVKILEHIGAKVARESNVLNVDNSNSSAPFVPDDLMREMRSSIIFLGAILARFQKAEMCSPGGCELGPRPIDIHINSMRKLGADIIEEHGKLVCKMSTPHPATVLLPFPSVGATENIMLLATSINGITTVINAAKEPEICDLQKFLNLCGAEIYGAGTDRIVINGGKKLHGTEFSVMPDRIAAITYLCAAAVTGGAIELQSVKPNDFSAVIEALSATGCSVLQENDRVKLKSLTKLRRVPLLKTQPFPGFPTDAQALLMALLTKAQGSSVFIETIFDSRYRHVPELCRLGADIRVEGRMAVVSGVDRLYGAKVAANDLRGGAALIIAALSAFGKSEITGVHHIERGYDNICSVLRSIGANMERIAV